MSEETKDWELWRQRNGHVVVVKKLDNDAPDLHRFRSVNCASKAWFPRGRHSLGEDNHPLDLVKFLGIVQSDDQKPNAPCQSAEIERLKAELQTVESLRTLANTDASAEFTAAQQLRSENERMQSEIERLQAELRGYAAESHRQLRALQDSHNKVTANLQAEQRGEREGFRIAISMILEALE